MIPPAKLRPALCGRAPRTAQANAPLRALVTLPCHLRSILLALRARRLSMNETPLWTWAHPLCIINKNVPGVIGEITTTLLRSKGAHISQQVRPPPLQT